MGNIKIKYYLNSLTTIKQVVNKCMQNNNPVPNKQQVYQKMVAVTIIIGNQITGL